MNEQVFYISEIIQKKIDGSISSAEEKDLTEWLSRSVANNELYQKLSDEKFVQQELEKFQRYDAEKNKDYLRGEFEKVRDVNRESGVERRIQLWKKIAVAASIIGVLFVAGYFIVSRESSVVSPEQITKLPNDVKAPDKNRAQIRLADGTTVYLDSAANGNLASMQGVTVVKTPDGRIEYRGPSTGSGPVVSGELIYNTLSNPRGSKVIDMTLADGSRVWLNAGSSVTYPVAFIGKERNVTITGEAYFEVAHNASKPFIVSKGDVNVTVLGTHFNVNAYDDESEIRVTLLEGSVKVQSIVDSRQSAVIRPGEQAVSIANGQLSINKDVDVEQVMAWKNGRFDFGENASIQEIMRQVARWYDVDIEYQGTVNQKFMGSISRQENVSKVLAKFEMTGRIQFKIEGRKITVKEMSNQ